MPNLNNRSAAVQAFSRTRQYLAGLSLQSRFLLIMGASSIFILLLSFVMFGNFTERLLTRIGSRFAVEQSLFDKERSLKPLISEMAIAVKLAGNPAIGAWLNNEDDPRFRRQAMDALRGNFQSENYFVVNLKSRNFYYDDAAKSGKRARMHYTLDPSAPDDAWIFEFIKSGENRGISVSANHRLGVIKLWVMAPIRKENRVVGIVGTGVNLYEFTRNASSVHLPGVTNMFIDSNTNIQVYNDINHFDFPTAPNFSEPAHVHLQILGQSAGKEWLHQTIHKLHDGKHGVETEFVQVNGRRYLAGLNALPEIGWYDLTLFDLSVLLPQTEFAKMLLTAIAGTLGLLLVLALSVHRLVLKPIAMLTDMVSRIRRGDFSSRPVEKSRGEVHELILQFHEMAGAIYNTQQWLEDEIEKRTRQLSDAQKVLEISLRHERDGRETQANLMALMAHEMRSPVAVISNTAQMLNMLAQSEHPDWLPRTEKIMRSVRQLSVLMDNFLTEKWLDMDKRGLNRVTGDLNQLCAEVTENFVENYARFVHFTPLAGDARICADWQLLRIAVLNLLDNAHKYSSRNDEISLNVLSGREGRLCIEVSDRGVGISPELQQHVFEKYARGRHEADILGSGLGLYLVNWIARFHGGLMEVSSIEGHGSTFHMCLPLCQPESEEERAVAEGRPA